MNTKSSLYRELSHKELFDICRKEFGTECDCAELLSGGLFNTTYCLMFRDTGKKYVLRAGPVNRQFLLSFEENMMNGEQEVYRLLKGRGIPCSTVVACDTSKSVVDRDYMIVEYIESFPLSDLDEKDARIPELYEEVGRYTRKMHDIVGTGFGRVSHAAAGKLFFGWREYFEDELHSWREQVERYRLYTVEELELIQKAFGKISPYLDEITQPRLVHADLWAGNVLIRREGEKFSVAAIIDADRAIWGDPDYDLSSGWMMGDPYLRGYGDISRDAHSALRKKFYQMMYRITDSYVWQVQYNTPENYQSAKAEGLTLAKEILETR